MRSEAEVNQTSNEPLSTGLAMEKNGLCLESQIAKVGHPKNQKKRLLE